MHTSHKGTSDDVNMVTTWTVASTWNNRLQVGSEFITRGASLWERLIVGTSLLTAGRENSVDEYTVLNMGKRKC